MAYDEGLAHRIRIRDIQRNDGQHLWVLIPQAYEVGIVGELARECSESLTQKLGCERKPQAFFRAGDKDSLVHFVALVFPPLLT